MKKIGLLVEFLAVFLFLAASAAAAGDLRNEDGKRYEVKVYEGSTTRSPRIDGNATTLSSCGSCEIEVAGIGKVKISGSKRAVIKNGRLIKQ
jgi:hypothetical protein